MHHIKMKLLVLLSISLIISGCEVIPEVPPVQLETLISTASSTIPMSSSQRPTVEPTPAQRPMTTNMVTPTVMPTLTPTQETTPPPVTPPVSSPTPTLTLAPTMAPTAVPTAVPTPSPPPTPTPVSAPDGLKLGDTGSSITSLQTRLNRFRYLISVNGVFGLETDYAVRDFQRRVNIAVNGIAGASTIEKLNATPARSPYVYSPFDAASDPVAQSYFQMVVNSADKPSKTGNLIYVNLSKHIVCIYEGSNHHWSQVTSFPCSVGKPETPTIRGNFTVGSKGLKYVTADNIILKYYTYFFGGFKFHSILYYPSDRVADGRIGYSISHGCVRLAIENAQFIHDHMPRGTAIWIQ